MTKYIKAPFNFVPLNEKVFFPDWADQISQDVPFSDGESGTIELELIAKTPIFVRNGHTRDDASKPNDNYTSFSKDAHGNYFIPATSIKGMIRNVMEIMSFGKMRLKGEYPQKELKEKNLKAEPFISKHHLSTKPDLADCVFGFVDVNDKNTLKGRVQFSHANCLNVVEVKECDLKTLTLASPKPSYFPIYLQQNGDAKRKGKVSGRYNTYENQSLIKGWKRYPVHSNFIEPADSNYKSEDDKKKQASLFKAISGAKFKSKIRFQNLKKAEIGALISAITFHQTAKCYHSIGSAKAYGYGKLEISVVKTDLAYPLRDYLRAFETSFSNDTENKFIIFNFISNKELIELISMAQNQNNSNDSLLEYMSLDKKDFKNAKDEKEFLQNYSKLTNIDLQAEIGKKPASKEELLLEKQKAEQEHLAIIEAQRLADEKKIADEIRKQKEAEELLAELERKNAQDELDAAERRKQQIDSGLSFLESVNDFEGARKRIDQWMKKASLEILPVAQHGFLFAALDRFYKNLKPRDTKKWDQPIMENHIWKKIEGWVGAEITQKWYNEIIK